MLKPRRISASHRDAFLERYKGLHAWAVQMTANDQALAEDLLHDLFILFTLNQPDLQQIDNLDNYLYACLRNLHISQLRRTTRGRFEQLSIVEYDSARLGLHSVSHGRDWIQVQDELRRICHYANARKGTASAASVLILRFFHGYYPTEIAKVIRITHAAVRKRLLAARVEAKAYLEDSKSLTFLNGPSEPSIPEVFPAKFARTPGDFLLELQETIFQTRPGECLSRQGLKDLYESDRGEPISRKHLAHIVSCPACLDTVNNLLGLPPLAERYPTDTMDKDNKKGGGPSDYGDKGGAVRNLKDWERDAREAFEHHPQELCVSVNGYLLGSQLIGSELSELTLNVAADERISFCEVFSEQGIRLMMMNVAELPPNGPGELHLRVNLSEARTLESALLFSNPFPTLHVTYHDPALAVEAVVDSEVSEPGEIATAPRSQEKRIRRLRLSSPINKFDKPISTLAKALGDRLLNSGFWLRPGAITAVFAVLLVAAALFVYRPRPVTVVTAADLLQKAALAEQAIAANRNQVLHRTINLEERAGSGEVIARRRVEVWQSAANGISARRLFDDKGSLMAGDWRRSDGVQTLYSHAARPQIKPVPPSGTNAPVAINFENAWQFLPSAKDFTSIVGGPESLRVEERASDYLISYAHDRSGGEADGVLKVDLVLSRSDLRATEQSFTLRKGSEVRKYRMIEASFEQRSTNDVPQSVFEPDADLLSSRKPETPNSKPESSAPTAKVLAASAGLEVELLERLNQANAFLGEQISVSRSADGQLRVEGVVDTSARKAEIVRALGPLMKNPSVRIGIDTVAEAQARQSPREQQSSTVTLQGVEVTEQRIAVDAELRRYLHGRGLAGDQLEVEMRRFTDRILQRSLQARLHARALKQIAERFSVSQLGTLENDERARWRAMINQHARACQQDIEVIRRDIQPLFPSFGGAAVRESPITDNEALLQAITRLYELSVANDESLRRSFSLYAGGAGDAPIKSSQFWRSLVGAESQAGKIASH
jgi:RNA polymerase sigma factor (sigma-70 family)